MSPPLHPGLTHWPFAFLTLSYALDVGLAFRAYIPAWLTTIVPLDASAARWAHALLALGVLTAIPAILSGASQAVSAVERSGLYDAAGKLRPKFTLVAAHALTADAVVGLSAWSWYRRSGEEGGLASVERAGAAVALGVVLVFSAHLGGRLTYTHGMGMAGAQKKKAT